jgi:ribosomal-protein-alanine N-acetyltransferase
MEFIIIDQTSGENEKFTNDAIASFLEVHLERFGDKKEDILKCIAYVFNPDRGGFITLGIENEAIVGAVIINETGMDGFIPENILVYIAVHENQRGKGMGSQLMHKAIGHAKGNIALHVEPDNPAKKLYERLGFTNKYLEMRLQR